ncbi:MAG: ferredoxin oxidoreductase [Candidatus Melainabacteria bacterium GWF2_32_7]|nr:MAG: ferredoxin oxidoreductase [Candidatus Melainabacteria bacterium GWF2_32_7]OGI21098.1 MAG: ferredoxin oxidoreductase [Candidatus Melainabacteria bacterium RIFOXYA2_FULL_32_9]
MVNKLIKEDTKLFMTGNEVIAYAANSAGAEFMYGYPITPQNEIMHTWCKLLPKTEAGFLQTEDEISAGFSTVGGILAGKKAFTATAGPGNVIMQDAMSMAEMMRIPFVCAVMQRGGPSTATVIYAQQETTLTVFGGNGEGHRIVYSTAGHQDLYDYTIKAFNTAWKYKFPTYILADGYQGKMREPVVMYDPESRGIEMIPATPFLRAEGVAGVDRKPVHMRNCFNLEEELMEVLDSYEEEFNRITPEIAEYKEYKADDADILIIAHGIVARSAITAIDELREKGIKAGLFRPVTIRPLAVEPLRNAVKRAKQVLFTESANGQMARMALEKLYGLNTPYDTLYKMGVGVTGGDIVEKVEQMLRQPASV